MRELVRRVLVLLVVAGGAAAALRLGREALDLSAADLRAALTLDEEARIERELARWEHQAGLPPGREVLLYRAVRDHVPAGATVHFVAGRELKPALAFTHLFVLLYPRRFVATPAVPPDWRTLLRRDPDLWLLELDQPETPGLGEVFEPIAAGEDFRLWRCRGPRRPGGNG